jgi:hypothetical protein
LKSNPGPEPRNAREMSDVRVIDRYLPFTRIPRCSNWKFHVGGPITPSSAEVRHSSAVNVRCRVWSE